MDSIKWKCKNWIVYFKIFDNFHFIHLIVEKLNVFNFHPIFSIVITNFTFTCEIWTRFLKNIHQKWKYYRGRKKNFERFWAVINRALTHTHPHPAKKRSHRPTPIQKRSHPPTPSQKKVTPTHTQSKKKGYTHPHLVKKRTFPPKFSRKCREKKIFHYQLGNRICQKLKKSSIPTDQVHRSVDINIFWAETLAGGNFYGTDFRDWQI